MSKAVRGIVLGLACACVPHSAPETGPSPEEVSMRYFVGHSIREAISAFGPPTETYQNGEMVLYIWDSSGPTHSASVGSGSERASASVGVSGGLAIGNSSGSSSGVAWTEHCREWFDVDQKEIIVSPHWSDACRGHRDILQKVAAATPPVKPKCADQCKQELDSCVSSDYQACVDRRDVCLRACKAAN